MEGRGVYIKTFGCQMNEHDTERMLGILGSLGINEVDNPKEADIIIFNTCAIRQKAEQKFMSYLGRIKHLKKKNPFLKIIVAGCSAQLNGEKFLNKFPYVDYIIGPDNISIIEKIIKNQVNSRVFTSENSHIALIDLPQKRKDSVSETLKALKALYILFFLIKLKTLEAI